MDIIHGIGELRQRIRAARTEGRTVGFVPTMGYLHEGHLSLMRQARAENDLVVASIFVNPLQFGPREDFASYPRDPERDATMAESAGVDLLFMPPVQEMYPRGPEKMLTYVEVRELTEGLCGASRPGHFRGVATVVTKLFNLVQPDRAYFGQKDAQQVAVIRRMTEDLSMNVRIVTVPIMREADGLAMSSRNVYLNPAERQAALVLVRSLRLALDRLVAGEREAASLVEAMKHLISAEPLAKIDYIEVRDAEGLQECAKVDGETLIALAVRIGNTRLIDNMIWKGESSVI